MRRFLASTLAIAALLTACGHGGAPAAPPAASVAGGGTQFLGQIADAPFHVAYSARRRVWQTYEEASGSATLEYTERVWSDGLGHFSVTPEQLLQPTLPAQQQQAFMLMQKAREGFIYRLRDFRIQELGAFLLSYTVEDLDQQVSVAGQACERLRIRPVTPGSCYWELDVDPSTGLILATREFQQGVAGDTLVALVETLEYQADPDLSTIPLHQDLPAVPYTQANALQLLGFTPLQPSFLPQGFALVKSEMLTVGGENWARCTYGNGGELLFLLYRLDAQATTATMDPGGAYTIKIFRAGRWTVAQSTFGRHRIIALGREPAAILQQVVESCAH